ncbi:MAG: 2-C-methyl-D-erythritol 4-phosphate cytidylyltransferase [Verrucomicrobiota bacterium]
MNTLVIIVACGKEEQITPGTDTAFLSLGNRPVLAHSLKTFQNSSTIDGIVVVVGKDRVDSCIQVVKRFGISKVRGIVAGGTNRLSSLRTAYAKLPEPASNIIVHEASRPFVSPRIVSEGVKAAKRYGCAIAAHRVPDSVKIASKGLKPDKTLERNSVWMAQTPQIFKSEVFEKIIAPGKKNIKLIDDESEWVNKPAEVHMVESGCGNIKIRTSDDFSEAAALFSARLNL